MNIIVDSRPYTHVSSEAGGGVRATCVLMRGKATGAARPGLGLGCDWLNTKCDILLKVTYTTYSANHCFHYNHDHSSYHRHHHWLRYLPGISTASSFIATTMAYIVMFIFLCDMPYAATLFHYCTLMFLFNIYMT